ncbi:MAG: 2-oxo acid dehydrogenase subunit E2 [Fimbriimonadaceae bacterium]
MPILDVRIPQMGEGLQEARLVAVLKKPGDTVRRDEPLYQMETDKAVMDVESPFAGVLVEWTAEVDQVLPIGASVAKMEVAEGTPVMEVHGHDPHPSAPAASASAPATSGAAPTTARNANVPPRTRAYAKEKGLSDEDLAELASRGAKLMPADIDAYLAEKADASPASEAAYDEAPLSAKQKLLASRLVRGSQLVVPGTISTPVAWEPIEDLRARYKAAGGDFQPSVFTMFAFGVARALAGHPAFRSTLTAGDILRTYRSASLGIAVALPGDELVLAVVEDADSLDWPAFAQATRERIELARQGKDQANEAVTLSLTNMQNFGLRDAVPVVVPPSVGTLFLGDVYRGLDPESEAPKTRRFANIALTFDHRVINGVGAAQFLNAVKTNVETIGQLIPAP